MTKKLHEVGKAAFESYYRSMFSSQNEFKDFLLNLSATTTPVLRYDQKDKQELQTLWQNAGLSWHELSWFAEAVYWPEEIPFGELLPGYMQHLFYPMNQTSLLPLFALELHSNEIVLDACAAPGGKSLAIRDKIDSSKGHVIANDLSANRVRKMKTVFNEYKAHDIEVVSMPAETIHIDAPEMFDKILLDAPCSSEKHIYNSPEEIAKWSAKRIKKLRQRQYVLIDKLLKALKVGGRLVYSTCAVNADENESVVARVLKNRSDSLNLVSINWSNTPGIAGLNQEYPVKFKLEAVRRVLPNAKENLDPMFVAVFEKHSH